MKNRDLEMSLIFKALADENRIKIVKMLLKGEMCAADILEELDVTQPTLSHHMKTLCESGIVKCRKSGKWMYYKISKTDCNNALDWFGELMNADEKKAEKKKSTPAKKKVVKKKVVAKTESEKEAVQEAPRRREVDIVIL